jgi:hypothetical protein
MLIRVIRQNMVRSRIRLLSYMYGFERCEKKTRPAVKVELRT